MAPPDYTRVNFAALEEGQRAYLRTLDAFTKRLDALEKYLDAHLDQWVGPAVEEYKVAKAMWDQECVNIGLAIQDMSRGIGDARQNYMDTEAANTRIWNT